MSTFTLEQAELRLAELIADLKHGEEVVIFRNEKPVARLMAPASAPTKRREPGFMKGSVLYMAPDFDAPLDDFKEYME